MDKLEVTVDNHGKSVRKLENEVSRGGNREYAGRATAYTYTGNNTASGTPPVPGVTIAVDPGFIPLGSYVYLEFPNRPDLNGRYVAQDTGSLIKGTKIDLFMASTSKCTEFGVQEVRIKI